MISYIEGNIKELTPTYIILDCHGIGYFINISLTTFSKIESKYDNKVKIFTHLHIREDAHTLFGFFEKEERKVFRLLISVSGVGASTGMMILSSLNPFEISQAIALEDINILKSIKGIGLKSAQRIIIDLKDKMHFDTTLVSQSLNEDNSIKKEALYALEKLGFSMKKMQPVVEKIIYENSNFSVEEVIKVALKTI